MSNESGIRITTIDLLCWTFVIEVGVGMNYVLPRLQKEMNSVSILSPYFELTELTLRAHTVAPTKFQWRSNDKGALFCHPSYIRIPHDKGCGIMVGPFCRAPFSGDTQIDNLG